MAECDTNIPRREDDIQEVLRSLRARITDYFEACHPTHRPDFEYKLKEIGDWVRKQKESEKDKSRQIYIENMGKVIVASVDTLGKFGSGSTHAVYKGVLEFKSSLTVLKGEPHGPVFKVLCCILSAALTVNKPNEPSVVAKLAEVVHSELTLFNRKYQDQKYNGLK